MKKIVIFLLVLFCAVNIQAQTYEKTQDRISNEIYCLQANLDKVRDQIFYLATLKEKIRLQTKEDSIKGKPSKELQKLLKEKMFAKEDSATLYRLKEILEKSLNDLKTIGLAGTENRIKADINSNTPEQMGRIEYNRRMRSLLFSLSKDVNGAKLFRVLLINNKTGVGENTTFTIKNRLVSETPLTFIVLPKTQKETFLPAGEYLLTISCGDYYREKIVHVNPTKIHSYGDEQAYLISEKHLSDF